MRKTKLKKIKKKMGRPIERTEPTRMVNFRLEESLIKALKDLSAAAGVPQVEYIRSMILAAKIKKGSLKRQDKKR